MSILTIFETPQTLKMFPKSRSMLYKHCRGVRPVSTLSDGSSACVKCREQVRSQTRSSNYFLSDGEIFVAHLCEVQILRRRLGTTRKFDQQSFLRILKKNTQTIYDYWASLHIIRHLVLLASLSLIHLFLLIDII